MKIVFQIGLTLSISLAAGITQAAESSFNPASLIVKISNDGRKPASTCITTDSLNALQALAMTDYSKCNKQELSLIRGLLIKVIDMMGPDVVDTSKSGLASLSTLAHIGAAKGSLALVDAQLAR